MSQQVKVFTTKSDNVNSTPRAQMVEGDNNRLLEVVFQPPYAPFGGMHARAYTHTHIHRVNKKFWRKKDQSVAVVNSRSQANLSLDPGSVSYFKTSF